jgi:uncharacterized metal-binding protein YceD (DUF177 family)
VGKLSAFSVPLKTMPEGTHEFAYHLDKQFFVTMESADVRDANLDVRLTVVYKHDLYNLAFHITGTVTLLCDRCLDDLVFPIDTTYDIAVKYGEDYDETDELLIIPEADNTLNVSYMIYDTASLAIPLKHVHPMGKCNRAMSALLRKHRAVKDDEDAALAETLIDEMETMDVDSVDEAPSSSGATDPRWDGLKKLSGIDSDSE